MTQAPGQAPEQTSPALAGQSGTGSRAVPPDVAPQSREAIWFAPTAEDWKKPCLVRWQRSFEDAIAVSKQTGRPILVCVNMDGEIASEHYAGVRYREPASAAFLEPYVCVIASVYRHTPRDYDSDGARILCPRFGSVTCGEHIAIEPLLYERFFEERRVAPRHIMLELDSTESYDVYYALDTKSVLTTIEEGMTKRTLPVTERVQHDMPIEERLASRDEQDRTLVERAWRDGTPKVRRELLEKARRTPQVPQLDLLRLALAGFDLELQSQARELLGGIPAEGFSEAAVDLVAKALAVPMPQAERDVLLAALARWSSGSVRAQTLEAVHRGLVRQSEVVDLSGWTRALASQEYQRSADWSARLSEQDARVLAEPNEPTARLALATQFLEAALEPGIATVQRDLLLEDCRRNALMAQDLGAQGFELSSALAVVAAFRGERDAALACALTALAALPANAHGHGAVAVLEIVARERSQAIAKAWKDKRTWPNEWMADLNGAYEVLAQHPRGREAHVLAHVDFLTWIGAQQAAAGALERGLARFPSSGELHLRLRTRVLGEDGAAALESRYETLRATHADWPHIDWFAGYATLIRAEHERRNADHEAALAAYDRGQILMESAFAKDDSVQASSMHYIALCHAGRARIALEQSRLEVAAEALLAAWEISPSSAGTLDGLGLSSVATAKALLVQLNQAQHVPLAARVQAGLDSLDASALEPPAFENDPQGRAPSRDAQRARQRPGG